MARREKSGRSRKNSPTSSVERYLGRATQKGRFTCKHMHKKSKKEGEKRLGENEREPFSSMKTANGPELLP